MTPRQCLDYVGASDAYSCAIDRIGPHDDPLVPNYKIPEDLWDAIGEFLSPDGKTILKSYTGDTDELLRDPSDAILVFETSGAMGCPYYCIDEFTPRNPNHRYLFIYQHHGGSNYLFLDGHVKTLTMSQTLVPKLLWPAMDKGNPYQVIQTIDPANIAKLLKSIRPPFH
jgi:prepilin-type processing-associated H-X9-DG protein